MKRALYILTFLTAFAIKAADPLYFIARPGTGNTTPPAGYTVYHPYKAHEIEIKVFRGKIEKLVADWIRKAEYPLIYEGGPNGEKNPYVEVDRNGHRVHRYRRYVYKPSLFTKPKPAPKSNSMAAEILGIPQKEEPQSKRIGTPIIVKEGLYKGRKLDSLVIVYELMPNGKSLCYDAYWIWSSAAAPKSYLGVRKGDLRLMPAGTLP